VRRVQTVDRGGLGPIAVIGRPLVLGRAAQRGYRLLRDQRRSPEAVRALQSHRLRAIVRHAYERTEFYRERFDAAGIAPADIREPADLSGLPITVREDLRSPERLIARGAARDRLKRSVTSGSTGRRTTTYFDDDAWLIGKYLIKLRARLACGVRPWDRIALLQEDAPERHRPPIGARIRAFSIHRPIEDVVAQAQAFNPQVLYGFPGYLARLAEIARGRLAPRLVFTSGELLDEVTRRRIETALATRVLDVYGCTEVKEIAWQCPLSEAYHLNADWLVLEALPEEPKTGRRGGALLVTSLFNYAMPLLRYALGDTGELLEQACPCGRGLPLVRPILGRSVDYLVLADGAVIPPYALTCAIEHFPGMRQYQIVQTALDRVEVRVVPLVDFDDAIRLGIQQSLRPVLHGLAAEVRVVDEIAPEASGKYRIVQSLVPERGRAAGPQGR
jgi:phenylacetate-CoA ligase